MFQNEGQKGSKMLGRNWENQLWDHFDDLKQAWWSQRRLHKASICSFWPSFHPIWTSVSIIFDLQCSSHNSLNELCCQYIKLQSTLLALMFIIHCSHSAIHTQRSHFTRWFVVAVFEVPTDKSQQPPYVQSRHDEAPITNWLPNETIFEVIMPSC